MIDRVRAQVAQVTQRVQEGAKAGRARLAESHSRRRVDALLRELGVASYAERTGRAGAGTDVERLVTELRSLEAAGFPIELPPDGDGDLDLDTL